MRCNDGVRGAFRRFLLTVDRDGRVRADQRAVDAAGAVVLDERGEAVPFPIDRGRETEAVLRAGGDTELASLADFGGNNDGSGDHGDSTIIIMPG